MTGSRKTNKPHHPSQQLPTYRRASRILAARDEIRRKSNEMHQNKRFPDSSAGQLKRSPSSYDLASKNKDNAVKAEIASSLDLDYDVDDGFMIVSMPGGVEAPAVDTRKAAAEGSAEVKPASESNDASETKSTKGFWSWSRGSSK